MKKKLTFLFSLLIISNLMAQKYETQTYETIQFFDEAELRYYPPVMKIKSPRSNGFRALFSYISGNNKTNQKISMTTPVYMRQDEQGEEVMEFVLPKDMDQSNTPSSNSQIVEVYESHSGYFIAIGFGGYAMERTVRKATDTLKAIAEKHHLRIKSSPLLLVYDSPYKLMNRKNEILFEIDNPSTVGE